MQVIYDSIISMWARN